MRRHTFHPIDGTGRCTVKGCAATSDARCAGGWWRHWFTVYGSVGESRDTCVRCGTPNPKFRERKIS